MAVVAGTPELEMLWETTDPTSTLSTRFGHRDADAAAKWVYNTLNAQWGLVVDRCERIVMSSDNALAWVTTPAGRLVVKWSVAAIRFRRLAALADLTAWLAHRRLPVSPPIAALDGRTHVELGDTSLSLQRHIDGEHLDTDVPSQVRQAGEVLARQHEALATFPDLIPDLTPPAPLSHQVNAWLDSAPDHPAEALDGLRHLVRETVPGALPTQLVHGDYRSANIIVDESGIVAVIDFEDARIDHRVAELARSAVLLGTRFHNWAPVSVGVHATLLDGYASEGRLTPAEASWWKPLVLWYSLRIAPTEGDAAAWTASALDQVRASKASERHE